jgi:hypothetical protein
MSWWQRNWKWFLPVGCATLAALAVAAAAGLLWLVSLGIRSSGAYEEALARARADCELQAALGAPVEPGWLVSGSVDVTGPSGQADLAIPLAGARGSGTLYLTATKTAGRWAFELLEVEVEGRDARIDLRGEDRRPCEEPNGDD